jgi:Domain of unknown function (DUF4365)
MTYTKRRVFQHIMEDRSIRIIQDLLPDQWVTRPYKPDYGIDLTIELFEFVDAEQREAATLGETLFVQVKSTEVVDAATIRVYGRRNVEKGPLKENRSHSVDMEVARLRLDTSELLTVQAIGSAVPVLLFLVELSTRNLYFVCLNDLIEKVIIPEDPEYARKQSKVLYIPLRNRVAPGDPVSLRPLKTYAKRPKLYAAFEKFAYQRHELEYAIASYGVAQSDESRSEAADDVLGLVRHFLVVILRYDFWERMPEWRSIAWSHRELFALRELTIQSQVQDDVAALQSYLLGEPAMRRDEGWVRSLDLLGAQAEVFSHIGFIWQRLANLAGMYEELGREWFLPTLLGDENVII